MTPNRFTSRVVWVMTFALAAVIVAPFVIGTIGLIVYALGGFPK